MKSTYLSSSLFSKIGLGLLLLVSGVFFAYLSPGSATLLLSDSFTGTTIDTNLWNVVDPGGTNVSQNNVLSISNSFSGGTWGNTAVYSKSTFSRTGLSVQAKVVPGVAQLLGYGDYNFTSAGTSAYIIDVTPPSILALTWSNGSLTGSSSCGSTASVTAVRLDVTATGMDLYADAGSGFVFRCSLAGLSSMDNKAIFMESHSTASTFDDLQANSLLAPAAISDLSALKGNTKVQLSWSAPADNGSSITDYTIDYRLSTTSTWTTFSDGISTNTSTIVTSLTNGSSYDFRVRGVNGVGTSTDSNIVSLTPTAPTGTPATVSGLVYWMDGSDTSTIAMTGTSTVIQVEDKSGNLRTASATGTASPSLVPNAQNSLSLLRFDGSSDFLTIATSTLYKTVFVVAKFSTSTFTDYNGLIGDSTGATFSNFGHVLNGIVNTTKVAKALAAITAAYRDGISTDFSSGYDFSPISQYWVGSFVDSTGQTNLKSTIGQIAGGGRYWNGDIAEIIVYDTVLNTTDRQTIESYLITKWGVSMPPAAISDLSATPGNSSIQLNWSAPSDYGSSITDYLIDYRLSASSTWTSLLDGTSANTGTVVTGLANGSTYDFRVRAVNSVGTAAESNIATSTFSAGIQITTPSRSVAASSTVATLAITDEGGTFYIPYIQTSSTLNVAATDNGTVSGGGGVKFVLTSSHSVQSVQYDMSSPYTAIFTGLAKDAYTLDVYVVDGSQVVQGGITKHDQAIDIGIGDIVTAIGDSITEGYYGSDYGSTAITSWVNAPAGSFSADYRNFPQYAPTSGTYKKSWMTELNNELTTYFGYPIFIMNEGVGGYKTSDYVTLMAASQWQTRQQALHANKWLIHLGVNDGVVSRAANLVKADLQTIITTLATTYGAASSSVFLAKPSYSNSYTYTVNYLTPIEELMTSNALSRGPDFWTYYGNDLSLYGGDPVHPTVAGMTQMARLWSLSLMSPLNFSATQTTSGVDLSWDDLSTFDATIAGYKIGYGTSSGSYATTTDVGSVTSTTVTGLSNAQQYYFTVFGYDNDAFVPNLTGYAAESSLLFDGAGPLLSSVTTTVGTVAATTTWTTDEAASSGITYGLTASYTTTTAETDTTTGVTSHSVSLSGLIPCTTYHYAVISRDQFLNATTSTDATFTTTCVIINPLLSDSFTGTTIDTNLWNVVDPGGTNVSQNNVLSISNSFSGGTWGNTAVYSKSTFSRTGLSVQAKVVPGVAQLLGYGDYNFTSAGTSAYIIDVTPPSILALTWSNGSLTGSSSCGSTASVTAVRLDVTATGMDLYADAGSGFVFRCSLAGLSSMDNKAIFMESHSTASTFDDLQANSLLAPAAISDLSALKGNTKVQLSWSAPADNGSSITDYTIDYRLSTTSTWTTFSDGISTNTSTIVTSLTNGSSYDFRVRGVNGVGTSTDSNIVSLTPTAPTGTPATVSGLVYWMDGSDTSTIAMTGTSTVIQVEDKSGNLRTASATGTASPSLVPNAQNSLSLLRFDGSSDFLTIATSTLYKTVFVVAKFSTSTFTDYNGLIGDSTGATTANDGHILNGVLNTTKLTKGLASYTAAYRDGISVDFSNGYDFTFINQYWVGSFVDSTGQTNVQSTIGRTLGGGRYWDGDIAEVIVYDTVLNDTDRQTIESYLISKWGVPQPPAAISDLSASVNSAHRMNLTWSAPTAHDAAITDYTIDYRLSTTSTWTNFVDDTSVNTTALVTGLTDGSSYDFRVRAISAMGIAPQSNIVSAIATTTVSGVPGTVEGLSYWMDGSDTSTITIVSTSTVTQVEDKSGNLRTASATSTASPSWISNAQNGRSLLRFNGTSNVLTIATSTVYKTVFVVAKFSTSTFTDYNGLIGDSTGATVSHDGHVLNGVPSTAKILGSRLGSVSEAYRTGVLADFLTDGYDFTSINQYWVGSFIDSTGQTNVQSTIGQVAGGGRYWDGDIAEIIVYDTVLNDTDRQTIESYLISKWGIPLPPDPIDDMYAIQGDSSVTLHWSAPSENDSAVTDYIVEYRLSTASAWTNFADGVSTSTSVVVSGLSNGLTYYFRVRALSDIGISADSNTVIATPDGGNNLSSGNGSGDGGILAHGFGGGSSLMTPQVPVVLPRSPPVATSSSSILISEAPVSDVVLNPLDLSKILKVFGLNRNTKIEDLVLQQVRADAKEFHVVLTSDQETAIRNFIVYGISASTIKLGQGERRAVIRDYFEAIHSADIFWSDVERMTNGLIPIHRNLVAERAQMPDVLRVFKKIFSHIPNFKNLTENLSWNVMMYRIRFPRDIARELKAIPEFQRMFHHSPHTPFDWAVLRVLAYVK